MLLFCFLVITTVLVCVVGKAGAVTEQVVCVAEANTDCADIECFVLPLNTCSPLPDEVTTGTPFSPPVYGLVLMTSAGNPPTFRFSVHPDDECKQNMQEMTKTMSNGDKRMVPDPNYDQCLAGFECKNDADEFDPDDANHYKEVDGKTTTTPLDEYVRTKELKGMSIYFSGDDWVVPVTEIYEIRIWSRILMKQDVAKILGEPEQEPPTPTVTPLR